MKYAIVNINYIQNLKFKIDNLKFRSSCDAIRSRSVILLLMIKFLLFQNH